MKRKTLPVARERWALDSGAFTELQKFGDWVTPQREYVSAVRRYASEIGSLDWAAPMDWMCEPFMLKNTGLTVFQHQLRTVTSFLSLRHEAAELPFAPVLQGWEADDYLRCWGLYEAAGVSLEDEPIVGVGSVCRRQATDEAEEIFTRLQPLRLHGFGVKTQGLGRFADLLVSSDSMAWSFAARYSDPLPGHTGHKNCANCLEYALLWRQRVLERMEIGN